MFVQALEEASTIEALAGHSCCLRLLVAPVTLRLFHHCTVQRLKCGLRPPSHLAQWLVTCRCESVLSDNLVRHMSCIMSDASSEDHEGLSRSANAALVNAEGKLLVNLVSTDGEYFESHLFPVDFDADEDEDDDEDTDAIYSCDGWLVGLCGEPGGNLFACDADGNVHHNASGSWLVEPVSPGRGLTAIRILRDGTVLAAGTAGIVFARGKTGWTALGTAFDGAITGIDGLSIRDFTICGAAGLIAQRRGDEWIRPKLPTDAQVNCVLATDDGYLAAGVGGALFREREGSWENLSKPGPDIHQLAIRHEEVWAACGSAGAARIAADGGVTIVRDSFAAYDIHAAGDYLGLSGNDIAVRFDGTDWFGRSYE